jgi:hypothetical protein
MGLGGQRHVPAASPQVRTQYPLYSRLGGPQSPSGRIRKTSPPPAFDARTVQPEASRYTDWAIPAHQSTGGHKMLWFKKSVTVTQAVTLRQARELISGPRLSNRVKFLSFNRTQSRVVTGFLTGHNTLRRHLFLLGLANSPVCRGCGVKEETSAHVLCECEASSSLRQMHLGSFFLEPGDIKNTGLGAICSFGKATGLPWFRFGAQRARS